LKKKSVLPKILAIVGITFTAFPVLATVLTGVPKTIQSGRLHFDYLLPFELFPLLLFGAGLILWAALQAKQRRKLIAYSVGALILLPVGSQVFAVATGLASGDTEPVGWLVTVGLILIIVIWLSLLDMIVAGGLLIADLFKRSKETAEPAP
jgi:hypothetical protein